LKDYIVNTEYFKTVYYLAACLYGAGKFNPANTIWEFLAAEDTAGEWQTRARAQLRNPSRDRAVEMP
jgi:hypothetical protein